MPPNKRRSLSDRNKRKRKFYGIRRHETHRGNNDELTRPFDPVEFDTTSNDPHCSTPKKVKLDSRSHKKLENSSFVEFQGGATRRSIRQYDLLKQKRKKPAQGFSLLNLSILQNALQSSVCCMFCKSAKSEMHVLTDIKKRHGLAEMIILQCSYCLHETKFYSSGKVERGKFEVNARSIASCNSLKGGRQVLAKFCGMMNLPPPIAAPSYSRQLKLLSSVAKTGAESQMKDAAKRICDIILRKNPNAGKEDVDGAISVAVSVDGTWQKRGYSSKFGVVLAILVDTGEVVDFEVLSLHCHGCKKHQNDDKASDAYTLWKKKHEIQCQLNFEGTAGGMEGKGAMNIFSRSIQKRGLKYVTFVGDGDSDTYKIVRDEMAKLYGKRYQVRKEECIGHIQKRMGNALRTLIRDMKGQKMSDSKSIGGKGRLTKERIDSFQRFYGNAIRGNIGNIGAMQDAIWAIFHHSVVPPRVTSLDMQHKYCPTGVDSWCAYNSGKATYDESKRLPTAFYDLLLPIFRRLSSSELLSKCQMGLTQNANESINHLIWDRCPKTSFCSKVRIEAAVSEAVCCFNTGAASKAMLLKAMGLCEIGENSFTALEKEDMLRKKSAAQKVTERYKKWRLQRKKTRKGQLKLSKEHYDPGGFNSRGERSGVRKRKIHITRVKRIKGKVKKEMAPKRDQSAVQCFDTDIQITMPHPLEIIKSYCKYQS